MTLLDRITEGLLIAVDTAPWIYVFESHPTYSPLPRPLFDDRFTKGQNQAGASILVLGELLVQPLTSAGTTWRMTTAVSSATRRA